MSGDRPAPYPPIRVLVNAVHARTGGGVTYLRHLLPLLAAESDIELHLIPHPSQAETFATRGVALHRQKLPAGWAALLLWEQLALPLVVRQLGCDLLFSPANFGPLAISRQVIVLQNALGVGALERRWRKRLYWTVLGVMTRLSLRRCERAIAVSRHAAASAGMASVGTAVIHHGVDGAFSPATAVERRRPFLLAVGDLYPQKNLSGLLDALALVRREAPDTTLRIAGAAIDHGYAAELRRRTMELGLENAVDFLGRVERPALIDLYRDCSAFVFPSLEESFGMPLLEAMACGAPIVAACCGATPEIAGTAALLVDPAEPARFATAILRVLGDPALAADLRRRGIERARAFSWEECARQTAAVLREAAGRRAMPCAA